jgi:hypothetical protein
MTVPPLRMQRVVGSSTNNTRQTRRTIEQMDGDGDRSHRQAGILPTVPSFILWLLLLRVHTRPARNAYIPEINQPARQAVAHHTIIHHVCHQSINLKTTAVHDTKQLAYQLAPSLHKQQNTSHSLIILFHPSRLFPPYLRSIHPSFSATNPTTSNGGYLLTFNHPSHR